MRWGRKLNDSKLVDSCVKVCLSSLSLRLVQDGLWDPYNNYHMGNCAEVMGINQVDHVMAGMRRDLWD